MMKNEKLYTDNFTMREQLETLLSKPEKKGFRQSITSTFSGLWGQQPPTVQADGKPLPLAESGFSGEQYTPTPEELAAAEAQGGRGELTAAGPAPGASVPSVPAAENIQAYVVRGGGQPGAQPQP